MSERHIVKPLALSAGEPAGIGPDLCLALVGKLLSLQVPIVVIADPEQLQNRATAMSLDIAITPYEPGQPVATDSICVLPIDLANKHVCGKPDPANAAALLDGLQQAVAGCMEGDFSALVTGPLQKSAINDAGIAFTGHTEFLAEAAGGCDPVMLLVADKLRVALVSTHLPLRDVADYISQERIRSVLQILHADLVRLFGIEEPEIVVCGLNPHAGEGGHLGDEDVDIIEPAVQTLRSEGMNVRGPLPADTAFTPAAGHADAVLAMYHDQGLPVLKYAGFGNAVNVTLGLPIIRTSVDHGTALDIAGTGNADTGSLRAAIELAVKLASK